MNTDHQWVNKIIDNLTNLSKIYFGFLFLFDRKGGVTAPGNAASNSVVRELQVGFSGADSTSSDARKSGLAATVDR